jgi:hypothetical protein
MADKERRTEAETTQCNTGTVYTRELKSILLNPHHDDPTNEIARNYREGESVSPYTTHFRDDPTPADY